MRIADYDEGILGSGGGKRDGDLLGDGGVSRQSCGGSQFTSPVVKGGEGEGWLGVVLGGVDVADFFWIDLQHFAEGTDAGLSAA